MIAGAGKSFQEVIGALKRKASGNNREDVF